jgi:hypothetical protein
MLGYHKLNFRTSTHPPTTTTTTTIFEAMHVRNVVCIVYMFCVCLCLKYIKYLKINAVQDISLRLIYQ